MSYPFTDEPKQMEGVRVMWLSSTQPIQHKESRGECFQRDFVVGAGVQPVEQSFGEGNVGIRLKRVSNETSAKSPILTTVAGSVIAWAKRAYSSL